MFDESGAFIFGRRTYDITNGWNGRHPVHGVPVLILTHQPPPASEVPRGPSNITFVTDGIESAVRQAKLAAGAKHVKLGGASPCKQALRAGLVDEILVYLLPVLLGDGIGMSAPGLPRIDLEPLSVELVMAEDGVEAVEAYRLGQFDLVLMDAQMPRMNGVEATRAIRALEAERAAPATPILALTANVMSHQVSEYLAAGMNGHVAKPIQAERLFHAMEAALDAATDEQAAA